ncbi:EAL domain-containing protein [Marinobacterium sp. AK62]|uniref:EAL domain-containing protein n=1 Tax=Marinobacterium alkalitolerans TaxID=1542925 RepID=A0ABS3Z845_9GAMM|nr:EAL domain-containing protein [Marinobacterium alkalitolerans]MBP0047886.1 EAL domain-containing protein [Marinobacterium alkalitolerans]
MKPFDAMPLRRLLPGGIVILALVLLLLALGVVRPFVSDLIHQNLEDDLRSTLNRLQGTTEYMLSRGDLAGLKREVAVASAHREVKHLLVLDANRQVVASSRLAQVGKSVNTLALHMSPDLLERSHNATEPIYERQSVGENTLYGVASYLYPDPENRLRDRTGTILLELDVQRVLQPFTSQLDKLFVWITLAVVLFAFLLWWLLEKWVTQRLQCITGAVKQLSTGDFSHRINLKGADELSQIGQVLDQMAGSLEASRAQIVKFNRQMENILKFIPSMVYIKDLNGVYRLYNERFVQVLGQPDENGSSVFDLLDDPYAQQIVVRDKEVLETRAPVQFQIEFPVKGELHRWFMVKFPLEDEQGNCYAVATVATDITEQERNESLLRIAQRVFEHTTEGIMITDADNRIVDVNESLVQMSGYSREELLGQAPSIQQSGQQDQAFYSRLWQTLREKGKWTGELENRRADGILYPVRLSVSGIYNRDGELDGYFGIFQDITEEKRAAQDLHRLAYHDSLTGLYNRTEFMHALTEAVHRGERYHEPFGLLFIDLDLFKEVNDSHGHAAGDRLLCEVAHRLCEEIRDSDRAFRLGGDEFTLLLPQVRDDTALSVVADKLIQRLRAPYLIDEREVRVGCSIGVVSYPRDGDTPEDLLGHADAAMYFAKELGRGRFAFFDPQINERNQRAMRIKAALPRALEQREFSLVYQPRLKPSGEITGYEALMRWHSSELGTVSPAEFIPLAETTDALEQMTAWLLQQVVDDLNDPRLASKQIGINLSPRQFQSGNWAETLRSTIEAHNIKPEQLCIEVTENALVEDFATTADQLAAVQALGVEVAIDDFGTGYSSLEYLKRLPIDYLKIDRSFVRDIETDADDRVIVETIIILAHSLGLQVVAEGVETRAQASFLEARGCDELQGYLFSAPRPLSELGEQQVKI